MCQVVHRVCGKNQVHVPQGPCGAMLWWPTAVAYFECIIRFITAQPTSIGPRHLILRYRGGLDAVEAPNDLWKKRKRATRSLQCEIDLYTTLEIVNEMLERGFRNSLAEPLQEPCDEFLIGRRYPYPAILCHGGSGWQCCPPGGLNTGRKANSSLRQNSTKRSGLS